MNPAAVGYQCPECLGEAVRTWPGRRRVSALRPRSVTTVLLAINVVMFLLELAVGATSAGGGIDGQELFDLGALQPLAIALGHQYWRLVTAMFLHAGLLHIALNMYGLYLFGSLIEQAFGAWRFVAIYLVSGFLASVASFALGQPQAVGVGASGAIFGLLGAWVAYNFRRRRSTFASANLRWAVMLILINLFLGFSLAGIDNVAHIGGLVAGMVAGSVTEGFGPYRFRPLQLWGGLSALLAAGILVTAWRASQLSASFGPVVAGAV